KHSDTKGKGALVPSALTNELLNANTDHGTPNKTDHLQFVDKQFVQNTNFTDGGGFLTADATHADSDAQVDVSSTPTIDKPNRKSTLKAVIHVQGQAEAFVPPAKD